MSPAARVATLSLSEVSERLEASPASTFVFDANPPEMFAEQHLPRARWVRFDGVTLNDLPADRSATLIFYCANERCLASHQAAKMASALGYINVFVMPAGIFGWSAAGHAVERG